MFKLIAILFAVVNGTPSDRPAGILTYNQATFATEEACEKFVKTDAGKAASEAIKQMVAAQHGAIVAGIACVKAEDNTI